MIKYLSHILSIPRLYIFFLKCYKAQKRFLHNSVILDIEEIKKNIDDSLSDKDFKKIISYYGLSVPIIGEAYCLLRGKSMSIQERKNLTYLGAATGLFDDFFDEKNTPLVHIQKMINDPKIDLTTNAHEQLFIKFYLQVLENHNTEEIKKYAQLVFEAQIQSKRQSDASISFDEILSITKLKGDTSFQFYRYTLEGNPSPNEMGILASVGTLSQLENDIFDIYKDYKQGVRTLATIEKSMSDLRKIYEEMMYEILRNVHNSEFNQLGKRRFSQCITLIATRGLVCLDQLEDLENGGQFSISSYSKKQLICDMNTFKNFNKWILYYVKFGKFIK